MRAAVVCGLAVVLVGTSLGSALTALPAGPPVELPADDPVAATAATLAWWGALGNSAFAAQAALGAAAVEAAPALAQARAPHDVLRVLAPVLEAQARAAEAAGVAPLTANGAALGRWADALHAAPGAASPAALPPAPAFASLDQALDALLAHYGYPANAADRASLAALAARDPVQAAALASLVGAHLQQAEATRRAFAATPSGPQVAAGGFDAELLAAARGEVERVVVASLPSLQLVPGLPPVRFLVCGVVDITHGPGSVEHACNVPLSVSVGADDAYANNAGGATRGAALLVDALGTTDTYAATADVGGLLGGAHLGSGFLYDDGGSDAFQASVGFGGVAGGAAQGAGYLAHGPGAASYVASAAFGGVAGGALQGLGYLRDEGGDNLYQLAVGYGGAGGAGLLGVGVLADMGGSDTYLAQGGSLAALNGAGVLGAGLLADAGAGDDAYTATGSAGAAQGGALAGLGALADDGGVNALVARLGPHGAVQGGASGALDLAHDNVYAGGLGVLLLGIGANTLDGAGVSEGAGRLGGIGVVVNLAGGVPAGADAVPGAVEYHSGPGLAQGGGDSLGVGLVVDDSLQGIFHLREGTVGQGEGQAGVGVMLHIRRDGHSTYQTDGASATTDVGGAGVGVNLDFGVISNLPILSCERSPELLVATFAVKPPGPASTASASAAVHVCSFDESSAQPILEGAPPALPKPSATCERIGLPDEVPVPPLTGDFCPVDELGFPTLVDMVLGPGASGWLAADELTTTLSGGFHTLFGRDSPDQFAGFQSVGTMPEGDDLCSAACNGLVAD